jgi:hypothetical protein
MAESMTTSRCVLLLLLVGVAVRAASGVTDGEKSRIVLLDPCCLACALVRLPASTSTGRSLFLSSLSVASY